MDIIADALQRYSYLAARFINPFSDLRVVVDGETGGYEERYGEYET